MPLEGSQLQSFFVETDEARDPNQCTRERIKMALKTDPARILFYGHPGSGKSTELNKFLSEHEEDYLPVKFSVTTAMTPSNVLAEDLILVITHIEELKEAFPARIEVTKTPDGSLIEIT